ncbi:glutamate decarboxylase [Tritrichomonas foetus]|uniref:Glutamate decarboxylase n=1 Tax=Tritrichomonas foetus TaxID=1144522 RepID=A0A1J4JXW3_9EUKA|nr:glutamate decarboxylase [Tritrichomonas foetus]|eukprot:OHT02109.1 glutamate decarboxylase [Tritrichomonas foetus]
MSHHCSFHLMNSRENDPIKDMNMPIFGSKSILEPLPKDVLPTAPTDPRIAYQLVKEETIAQIQPRLNLATFVTTYMDSYATRLMNDTIDVNYIDETEYPRIAGMTAKCINMIANLWNTPEKEEWKTGAVAIGSSEACMLGGVAAWIQWKKRRQAAGKPYDKPNFVISAAYQVVWEKFALMWQIEMRTIPLSEDKRTLQPEDVIANCDENTIFVVAIEGVTWTGLNDDVEAIDKALDEFNTKNNLQIPIHIDGATGGFILPFLKPEHKWDFRLKWVYSINTSGHKYGLVYPGLGWIIWRGRECVPEEMSFSVNYLGAQITQIGLNFSRPASQIVGQYYQFIRHGFEGYKSVQYNSWVIAKFLHETICDFKIFRAYSNDVDNPVFIFMLDPEFEEKSKWTLFDLEDGLKQYGWMVPAYTMPANIEYLTVMRIVVRAGFSRDMADMLLTDMKAAVEKLQMLEYPTHSRIQRDQNVKNQKSAVVHC